MELLASEGSLNMKSMIGYIKVNMIPTIFLFPVGKIHFWYELQTVHRQFEP